MLTHFVVSDDVARSRRSYNEVLGDEVVREGAPTVVALANRWIINVGGGPTDEKPVLVVLIRAVRDWDFITRMGSGQLLELKE